MRTIVLILVVWCGLLQGLEAQKKRRPRVLLAGGVEMGWSHTRPLGNNYHQNARSTRYYGEFIYRYNGLNHFVISGGYSRDSLTFRNNNTYLTDVSEGYGHISSFHTNGLIKTQSAWFGGAWLLTLGRPLFGLDIQLGASGRYIFEAIRYGMPDETFEYRLDKEIQPFNVVLQPKLALRLSYFRFAVSYEVPLLDHINHNYLIKMKPYEHRSADMRGLRMDNSLLFLSVSLALPVEKAITFLSNEIEKKL